MSSRIALAIVFQLHVAFANDSVVSKLGPVRADLPVLPSNFASFSYEVGCITAMFTFNGGARQSFANLMNNLRMSGSAGPNIRIGGNSADNSAYIPSGTLPLNISYRITDADFKAYAAMVPLFNGTITPGLNFREVKADGTGDATFAMAHVVGMSSIIPLDSPMIEGFEIGNENDLYNGNGIRTSNFTAQDYLTQWGNVARALTQTSGVPMHKLQGATWCCNHDNFDSVMNSYIANGAQAGLLSSISYHDYPLSVCGGKRVNTVFDLLANRSSDTSPAHLAPFVALARTNGLPFYVGEGNSVSCGGEANVSDIFGATLWAVDVMLAHANVGITRFNFHGCPQGAYTAIAYDTAAGAPDTPEVRPLYYGMWAMSRIVADYAAVLSVDTTTSNGLIRMWAVTDATGRTRVIAIHKDPNATAPASVTVVPATAARTGATLTRLASGSGVFAKVGIKFGGQTFDGSADGKPLGAPTTEPVPANGGQYKFMLPPATIAILEF